MIKAFIIAAFIFSFVFPSSAQDLPDRSAACRDAAQDWYDDIPSDSLLFAWVDALSATMASEQNDALDGFIAIRDEIEEKDYPLCIERARAWWLEAMEKSVEVARLYVNEDDGLQRALIDRAAMLGAYHGYLVALGVELEDSDLTSMK